MGKYSYEFIFTSLVKKSPRLFTTAHAVYRAYQTTTMYRNLKLRGAIIQNNNLVLLPKEQVFRKINGVWNLSSDQGNLGTMYVTNIRVVWHANLAENFNVSIPYLQMMLIRIRKSKFGPALVINTNKYSGGYVLGFRLEEYKEVFTQVRKLRQVFASKPIYGVEFTVEDTSPTLQQLTVARKEDDIEIVESDAGRSGMDRVYQLGTIGQQENEGSDGDESGSKIVFDRELGLAMQNLPNDLTPSQLWQVM